MMTLARQCAQALERAYLYEAERLARETAEAANRVKDEFLAVLSHELRSPLNPILGWTKMLRSHRFDARMTDRALEAIERNAKLQIQLIEDLLDVSHILQGKLRLNRSVVDLVAVIEAALETMRLAAESKSIQLQFRYDSALSGSTSATPLQVMGDVNRLQQIVWNLVSNAVKFTPPGGRVDVSLRLIAPGGNSDSTETTGETSEAAAAVISQPVLNQPNSTELSHQLSLQRLSTSRYYGEITVADTGQGIDPISLPCIFDYFRQADSTITRQFGGLGLGLTIVRHLVELHGGIIQAESEGENRGATFRVRLPLLTQAQRNAVASTAAPIPKLELLPSLSKARILVVDHDADMREYVDAVLRAAGAQVALAGSAGEALAKLSRFKPNLLISDIGLPNVDGYMLLRQIRSLVPELGSQIPAIALTGYAGEYDQQQILAAGFQSHITKPIEPEALIATIARLLSHNHADHTQDHTAQDHTTGT
jgi:signal transduction histidine kinase/CheY-like chemotaxis protein